MPDSAVDAGNEWKWFRLGYQDYQSGGRRARYRVGSEPLHVGDTFNVDFDLSGFDRNDPEDKKMIEKYGVHPAA